MRFSLRDLLLVTFIVAQVVGQVAQFVEKNRSDWRIEQAAMLDGAVRWDERTYIPNLDVGSTCTIPEWVACWLPLEHREIYYRVTELDIRSGSADPADFQRCLCFQNVTTISLGSSVYDAPQLIAIFKKFPQLRCIHLDAEFDSNNTSILALIKRELPGVQAVNHSREH